MASIIKVDTIQSTTSNVFFQNSSGTEYARFDSSGNLGIGTTTPGAKLDVRGSSTFLINAANPTAWVSSDSTLVTQSMYMQVNTTSSDTRLGSYTNHPLVFLTNNAERMRIDSSGNVGIGTGSPSKKLDVFNSGTTTTDFVVRNGTVSLLSFVDSGAGYTGTSTNHPLLFTTNNTERMRLDTSGNLLFNSGYGSVATAYGCRAWVNFNGTGVVAIRASGNVSSITDNGTGDYTVNFTNAMPDVNYVASLCTTEYASTNNVVYPTITGTTSSGATLQSTTQLRFNTASLGSPSTKYDMALICVSIFR